MNISDIEKTKENIESEEVKRWNESLSNAVKIDTIVNGSEIELSNGEKIAVSGTPFEIDIDINRCVYCGKIGEEDKPLYTMDNKTYLCKHCTILAFKTYIDHDYEMPSIEEMKKDEKFNAYKY